MDAAIEYAESLCPQHNISSLITPYFNKTTFPDPVRDLPKFLCAYKDTMDWTARSDTPTTILITCILVGLGVPSAVMALITFSVKEFRNVSFFYHRYINVLDLIFSIYYIFYFVQWCLGARAHDYLFFTLLSQFLTGRIAAAVQQAAEWVTIWVSFERAMLCNSPQIFEKINKKRVAWLAVAVATALPVLFMAPFTLDAYITWNDKTGHYERVLTEFGKSRGLRMYSYVIGLLLTYGPVMLIVPASAFTILGLVQMSKRKRALMGESASRSMKSTTTQNLLNQININRQLCLLQACEAIPIMICQGLLAIMRSTSSVADLATLTSGNTSLADAMWMVTWKFRFNTFFGQSSNITCAIAHSTHFFRYVLFSVKVRKVAQRIIFARGDSVTTTTISAASTTGVTSLRPTEKVA